MEFKHQSVLLEETIRNLRVKPDGIYVDGTLGGGGHSYRICQQLSAKGSLIGIDQDEAAIKAAGERLKDFKENGITKDRNHISRWDYFRFGGIFLPVGQQGQRLYVQGGCPS